MAATLWQHPFEGPSAMRRHAISSEQAGGAMDRDGGTGLAHAVALAGHKGE